MAQQHRKAELIWNHQTLDELKQTLIGYSGVEVEGFDVKKPSTYGKAFDMSKTENKGKETNVRHYTMIIWINEAGSGNVAEAGKVFAAGITFNTGTNSGVTGVIALADDAD